MRIQAYTAYQGTIIITAATNRAPEVPSTRFTAASIHEDYCARVRGLLEEHKHVDATSLAYPAAQRLSTYFPVGGTQAAPVYGLRQLMPSGAPRDIDDKWMLEIMRIRYVFTINLLPASFASGEYDRNAIERNVSKAVHDLFAANNVPADAIYLPGDNNEREQEAGHTEIDIICELGPATARTGVDIPQPAAG